MSSRSVGTVPIIDFSKQDLKPGSPEWDSVKVQVREALEEYGCFEAKFDQVLGLRRPLFGAVEELFDLPFQTKKLYVSDKLFRGYSGFESGYLETISTDDAHIAENIEQGLTTTLWPQGNINFSKTVVSFTQLASGLEKTIKRMILESFGLEKYLDELTDATNYQLRVNKYKAPKTNEPDFEALAHYDQDMLTLLYQPHEVHGLEIKRKDGQWIPVKPSPNSFVVVTGHSLGVWLNGRLSAPYHRVIMKGNKTRYCLGLFATPRGGYQVKAPKELVDDKHPRLFKPFDYEEFLGFYSTQGDVESDLKVYSSI